MEYLSLNSFETKRSVTIDSLKTHFLPIQEGEGDPSPDNIRPITGWNSIKVRKCGKNLAKIVGYSAGSKYGTSINTDTLDGSVIVTQSNYDESRVIYYYTNGYFTVYIDDIVFDKKYNVSFKVSNVTSNPLNASLSNLRVLGPSGSEKGATAVQEDGAVIFNGLNYKKNATSQDHYIAIRVCGMSFTLSEFMITAVEDEDFTYEPYREEEVEVELPETMYGGYVDIAKGEIVQEYKFITITGSESSASFSWNAYTFPSSGLVSSNNIWAVKACSHTSNLLSGTGMYNSMSSGFDNAVCVSRSPVVRYRDRNNFTNLETAKTYLQGQYANGTPVQIVAQLEIPIHYQIPPETLKTLRGFNTIFSTGNDSIEVGYSELSPMSLLELRRNIIASEPHLVTVETGNTEDSDVIASFNTNTALSIKSMITYFEPKQEGEGDPSPDNIRPITGLSELEIHNYPHLVQWNQWLQPLSEENWNPYNSSRISVTYSDGVVTSEWLVDSSGGYTTSVRNKALIPNPEGHIWYVSYMVKHHAQDIKHFGVEFAGGRQIRAIVTAEPDVWYQVSTVASWYKNSNQYVYISNISNGEGEIGLIVESKSPVYIDLTKMFGAGNEPTKEEFEAQCALNGIDLTTYNQYDEGTVIPWRTSANEDRVYQIPLTLPNLITPEPKSITSYNVDFTVNDDGTVDYEGTPTSYASVVVGYYHVKGGETITVTLCGDTANLCFNAQRLYDSNGNIIPFLGNVNNYEGRKTYTIDLSEYPDAYSLVIHLKRYLNDAYMKGKCWVRVVEGAVDTGDEVYGGYVDLDNNELVVTYGQRKIFGNENWIMSGGISGYCAYRPTIAGFVPVSSEYVKPICNKLKSVAQWATKLYEATINRYGNFYFGAPEELSTKEAVNEWVKEIGGIDVVYPLATPLHFPLSPTVIRTLKGMNNIYTNTNGKTIIKYWTH